MTDQTNEKVVQESLEQVTNDECVQTVMEQNVGDNKEKDVIEKEAQEAIKETIAEAHKEEPAEVRREEVRKEEVHKEEVRKEAPQSQATENKPEYCPKCGSRVKEIVAGSIVKYVCAGCEHELSIGEGDALSRIHAFNEFANAVLDGFRDEDEWDHNKVEKLDKKIRNNLRELSGNPFFQMLEIVRLTKGFQGLPRRRHEQENVVTYYKTVSEFYKTHKFVEKPENLAMLIKRYEVMIKNVKKDGRKRLAKILSFTLIPLAAVVITAFALLYFYTPKLSDESNGIVIRATNDTFSLFDKLGVEMTAEQCPENSVSYIDAKNALRNETEKFVLFDLAIKRQNKVVDFDTEITVEIPIPTGYQASCLKVYHVISDEEYEEIPSVVSVANNTISFKTTHFSFYAIAERHPIVHFDSDGAQEVDMQIVERDTKLTAPTEPTKVGYTFGGWIYDGKVWNFETDTVKKDITLTAKWILNKYTVTLVAEGGNLTADTVEVTFMGDYAVLPENVDKPGYTFMGWFTALENGVKIESETKVALAENHTLYAHFETNTNTLVFDANSGSGSMTELKLLTGGNAKLPKNTFTKTGYTFMGWSLTKTGDVVFADQANYTMGTNATNTLYAQWQINTNAVKFDGNGGEGTMESLPMDYNTTQRLPVNIFVRPGYSFIGWSTTPAGEVLYQDKAEYTMGEKAEYLLYAQWQVNINHVHFDANGGIGTMNHVEKAFGELIHLPACTFTREGYRFDGWSLTANGSKVYGDEAEYRITADAEVTLYACWVGIENSFTFYANGGIGNMRSDFTIPTGGKANLPANQFTRGGYRFIGWSTDPNGIADYEDCEEYTMATSKAVKLYAVWEVVGYTITFASNGGSSVADISYHAETDTFDLPSPTKDGYRFIGWFESELLTGSMVEEINKGTYGDKTFYAKWEVVGYTITFDSTGGSSCDSVSYHIEMPTFNLPTPTRTGYDFVGWHKESDLSDTAFTSVAVGTLGDMQLYAEWSVVSYKVTFNTNGGDTVADMAYHIESEYFLLPEATKTGYTFMGWYSDPDFETDRIYGVQTGSHGDLTVYAKWTLTDYKVTFDSNEGSSINPLVYHIETGSFKLPKPTRNGYTFMGWYDNEEFDGDKIESLVQGSIGDRTFYAKWSEPIEYSITFYPNGGSEVAKIYYDVETDTFELPTPTRTGYVFAGWYNNNSFTGSAISMVSNGTYDNIKLYAKWELQRYTISYDMNGGVPISDGSYHIESEFKLPIPERGGYEFLGWYNNRAFEGDAIEWLTPGNIGTKTYYARWSEPIEYTISFDSKGGNSISSITYNVQSSPLYLNEIFEPSRTYYAFAGWYDNPEYTGVKVTEIPTGSYGTYCLYAKWTPVNYRITYNTNGGDALSPTSYHIETPTFDLPKPTKTGYTFKGWYDNEELTGDEVVSITLGTTGDMQFYAKWEATSYVVTFDENGGTVSVFSKDVVFDATYGTLPIPTRTGHTFAGWYTDKTDGSKVVDSTLVTTASNHTLYAQWTVNEYTISFVTADGTSIAARTYKYSSKTSAPSNPVRDGYNFTGWTFNCSGFKFGDAMPARNIIATATWAYKTVYYDSGYGEMTIDGSYEKTLDTLYLSSLSRFMNAGYTLRFTIQIYMREKESGYQEIYLCKGDQTHVAGISNYEYGGGGDANKSFSWVTFEWYANGASCTETMLLRYGANGKYSDDWVRAHVVVTVSIV